QGLGHTLMVLVEKIFGEGLQYPAAFLLGLLGTVLLFIGMKKNDEVPATWLGYFAGFCLWTGWVEFSFVFYAEYLNVEQILPNGKLNLYPEYLVMQSSIGVLMTSLLYFFFNRETKCNFFRWFQRHLKLSTGKPTPGYKRNYAAVTAMETVYVIWFFYIILLILYEDAFIGDRHPLTYIFFFLNTIGALFLVIRLMKFWNVTRAIRYAIPTAIIAYTSYEIIGRWGLLIEFWVYPKEYLTELVLIFGAILIGIFIAVFTPKGEKERLHRKQ
ncbi:MAG: hypothetical protein VX772_10280, partial [Bacteroidota bacterium]|nr:hypothetical protein [Bacteroidota bacterium]